MATAGGDGGDGGVGERPEEQPEERPEERPSGVRLGLTLALTGGDGLAEQLSLAEEADRVGFDVCWVAEAYGTDAVSVLAYLAARTSRIDLGAAVLQIPARAPAMTAMTAVTIDQLSGGRFRLGVGVSGPQVSEGWYGVGFARPLRRTREYLEVVRAVLRRERLEYEGDSIRLPLPPDAPGSTGSGKALKLATGPVRPDLPLYLAAVGPANLRLAGELADGWLGVFVAPDFVRESLAEIEAGRAKRATVAGAGDGAGAGTSAGTSGGPAGGVATDFDAVATVPLVIGDDLEACAAQVRAYAALYLGGMGSREQNFYNALAVRMGYADAAADVQEHFLAGRYREAAAAVPMEFVDATAMIGPPDRIVTRLAAYAAAGVGTVSVLPLAMTADDRRAALHTMAELRGALSS